ncbi:hypothetical protein CLV24_11198 [Pontibacter ummariensis]|uniref:Uncharacterized protein n=1 Tax=Pontibacter ummariensis TaxID=1610492 RepID=A0A239GKB9_9BACT|nr:hypothetical protein [Pontibacter ummariensis]PRY11303.1 hypothetical protein CLV24_11198 [Pontibacter ummariensis]SNS69325.1 hypothetical protein SAMN06296052_11198 [Pontibacter ummariensis]
MISFFRSLFGLKESTDTRTVVGDLAHVDPKDVPYIKHSHKRLKALQELHARFKGTPQEEKFKAVYEKTKHIHSYLVGLKRVHELELFHLQHTEHFINTYSVIMDVHESQTAPAGRAAGMGMKRELRVDSFPKRVKVGRTNGSGHAPDRHFAYKGGEAATLVASGTAVAVPEVSIDTFSRITYAGEHASQEAFSGEIGFTSTAEEKDDFLLVVAALFGIERESLAYVGNTPLAVPTPDGANLTQCLPVIYWRGVSYALDLEEHRLFPVRIYRRGL